MTRTPSNTDTFLKQFPMFYLDDTTGLAGYRWKHPDNPGMNVLLYKHPLSPWCVLVSSVYDDALGVPQGTYDDHEFPTPEAAATWLLLEGLITCGAP